MNKLLLTFTFLLTILLGFNSEITAQITSAALGTSTSSSSGRGPFQRSSISSGSVYSRAHLVYTATELAGIGITSGAVISQVNWDLGSTNVITAGGDATLNVYMKNSAIAGTAVAQWSDITNGATLVGTYTFNTTNNFPGVEGFMNFVTSDFTYTGGSIEIAVDWDCSNLIPLDPLAPNQLFDGNGSLNWHWSGTTHNSSADRAGTSGAPSEIQGPLMERVNTQFVYTAGGGAVQDVCIGTSTSSSSGRGPFQRSSISSGSVYSRAHLVYLPAELTGLTSGSIVSKISWDLGSTNVITAGGDATLNVYMKNSAIAGTAIAQWSDIINGATLVGTYTFNTTNNFPGVEGFMDFDLSTSFVYTGGSIEVAVDWDCSNLTPLDPLAPNQLFDGNGSLNWHWSATTHNSSADRAGTSGAPSEIQGPLMERVNTCFEFTTALPVDLSIFEGKLQNKSSLLNWETQTEQNNDYFEVQHSTNGREFSTLDKVAGNGTTSDVQNYNYTHKNVTSSDNYYRLKQVDFDGEFEYSDIIYLQNDTRDTPVAIYPNPARELVTYEGAAATLTFFDIQGRRVMQQTAINTRTAIDISTLRSGVYTIEILTNTGERTFEKLIKE